MPLKALIDKLSGDARLYMQRRTIDGLKKVKEVGDTADHDFRITIRRSDLEEDSNSRAPHLRAPHLYNWRVRTEGVAVSICEPACNWYSCRLPYSAQESRAQLAL